MPIVEIFLLIQVGSAIGALATIAIVVATAMLGTWMLRRQGIATATLARARLASGEIPAFQLLEGLALGIGGALLLTPGFVTDAIGFACLLPPTRHLLISAISKRVSIAGMAAGVAGAGTRATHDQASGKNSNKRSPSGKGDIIDGEFTRKD